MYICTYVSDRQHQSLQQLQCVHCVTGVVRVLVCRNLLRHASGPAERCSCLVPIVFLIHITVPLECFVITITISIPRNNLV